MPKYVVRHGVMRSLGVFSARGGDVFARGSQVIARTQRGLELGEVLCEATEQSAASLQGAKGGQILRGQTPEDLGELRRLAEQELREFDVCKQRVAELQLDLKLIDVERLYGGERVVVYYLAEGRIDFRQLVKVLAKEFQTRVEMRQIGVRDEAKLLADYGDCGKPVCCNTHLSEMPPVSMRMAKLQKATLDPSKISGRCGRLKCCLRYEYDTYVELQKDLPPVGSEILTAKGRARVLAQEILTGQLLVETEDMRRVAIDAADVLTVVKRGGPRGKGEAPGLGRAPAEEASSDARPSAGPSSAGPSSAGRRPSSRGGRSGREDRAADFARKSAAETAEEPAVEAAATPSPRRAAEIAPSPPAASANPDAARGGPTAGRLRQPRRRQGRPDRRAFAAAAPSRSRAAAAGGFVVVTSPAVPSPPLRAASPLAAFNASCVEPPTTAFAAAFWFVRRLPVDRAARGARPLGDPSHLS